jgi:hypothetical protein
MNIPVKETTLSGWLVPTNSGRDSNGSGTAFHWQNISSSKTGSGQVN